MQLPCTNQTCLISVWSDKSNFFFNRQTAKWMMCNISSVDGLVILEEPYGCLKDVGLIINDQKL